MTASVRVLTRSSRDASPAVLFVAPDGSKVLINCGEGCQRSFLEFSERLSTVRAVCLTHISCDSVGGLPGMILTSADSAALNSAISSATANKSAGGTQIESLTGASAFRGLDVIGPVGTKDFMHALRHFVRRDAFCVNAREGRVQDFRPELIRRPSKKYKEKDVDDLQCWSFSIDSYAFYDDMSTNHPSGRKRPRTEHNQQVLSFAVKTPPVPGKFMPDRAKELGVPPGPLYGRLKSGKPVTFEDACGNIKTVSSDQVVLPASPGVVTLVLYYPTLLIGKAIFASESLENLITSLDVIVELIIHMAPRNLFLELRSMHWAKNGLHHMLVDTDPFSDEYGTPFRSAAEGAQCRSYLCPEIYHFSGAALGSVTEDDGAEFIVGRPQLEYVLVPRSKRGFKQPTYTRASDQEILDLIEASGALSLAATILDEQPTLVSPLPTDGELIFTGTGSALPCKHRNVTGMLLNDNMGRGLLLDVGEGTVGQLLLSASGGDATEVLSNIKAAWISHPHADHHLGLMRLLEQRPGQEPLLLIAPGPIFHFLREYEAINPAIEGTYTPIDCQELIIENPAVNLLLEQALRITSCRVVPVTHCPDAYALIVEGSAFGRLVYSGDCRPSRSLAMAALGADLLIHEATFEDGMEAEAALKKHSTVGEALGVAHEMKAKCVILTHFSQRYPRIPPVREKEQQSSVPVVFAFDHMRVNPQNLLVASRLTPALRLLYPENEEAVEVEDELSATNAVVAMSTPGLFAQPGLL